MRDIIPTIQYVAHLQRASITDSGARQRVFSFAHNRAPRIITVIRRARIAELYRRINAGQEISFGDDAKKLLWELCFMKTIKEHKRSAGAHAENKHFYVTYSPSVSIVVP